MNKTLKWALIGAGILIAGTALVFGGIGIGRTLAFQQVNTAYGTMGPGMMTGFNGETGDGTVGSYGPQMMAGQQGMMGAYGNRSNGAYAYGNGMMSSSMMSGGMMAHDMMGSYGSGLVDADPLSVEEARSAIEEYLATLGNDDLELHEVMIFDNHAYGMIVEKSTGIGAMEVLVDPVTQTVYPEHGPNMMWNLAYSPMGGAGYGMMGGSMMGQGMMGGGYGPQDSIDPSVDMPVSEGEAVEAAQQYLDAYLPGTTVEDHADPFYGYYTLHILRDGEIIGMLSVNGYSADVFLHTWHGEFIEMAE